MSNSGFEAIHIAARDGNVQMLEMILAAGGDVNLPKRSDGWTPLHLASANKHADCVKLLLARGGDVNAGSDDGLTPIASACLKRGNLEVVKLLVQAGADVNAKHTMLRSVVALAVHKGDEDVVRYLIEAGATADEQEHSLILQSACVKGRIAIFRAVERILSDSAYTSRCGEIEAMPLHVACSHTRHEAAEIVAALLERQDVVACINDGDRDGDTAVRIACACGNTAALKLLLRAGAHV